MAHGKQRDRCLSVSDNSLNGSGRPARELLLLPLGTLIHTGETPVPRRPSSFVVDSGFIGGYSRLCMTRDEAWSLLNEYTKSESLIKHALGVEAAMRHYAEHFREPVEQWGVTGLIHDFDYERWPNPPDHTREGARILRQRGVDEEIIGAILSHAEWNQDEYPLDRPIRKALFAVDELCGFITAVAYVRPEKLAGMAASSVRKKMKQKSFAAAVKREDIEKGAALLGLPLDDHIHHVIAGVQTVAGPLGFA
jgi:putative nucleotidyltransferase with HDIG domain